MQQYKRDRKPTPHTPLLNNAIVHFAADPDEVFMTTKLTGENTFFLPFNQGTEDGQPGNPTPKTGIKTDYFWKETLKPEKLLSIINDFVTIEPATKGNHARTIFPRYHQHRAVTNLIDAFLNTNQKQFLIQHSPGSGKTKTIAWLAHLGNKLFDHNNKPMFDGVIVVSDRENLDDNLAQDLSYPESANGIVVNVQREDKNSKSATLQKYLEQGNHILSTTIQTFPALARKIDESYKLKKKKWLLIFDEAHSSQHGKSSKSIVGLLSTNTLSVAAELASEYDEHKYDDEEFVIQEPELNTPATDVNPNLTIVAFTATPRDRTLDTFGQPDPNDLKRHIAFDLYSMVQAIREGFIIDPLMSYHTPSVIAKVIDPSSRETQVELGKATSALIRFVKSNEKTIENKALIAVDHFYRNVKERLKEDSKAMIVTKSRMDAYTWYMAIQKVIDETPKYHGMKSVIAFSDALKVRRNGEDTTVTDYALNAEQLEPNERPMQADKLFASNSKYKFLIVANKFQTGYDEPRLMAMYIDKTLQGIQAVQTVSRLNRALPDKKQVFVIDFENTREDIEKAFAPYYVQTQSAGTIDISSVPVLADDIVNSGFYTDFEFNAVLQGSNDDVYSALSAIKQRVDDALALPDDTDRPSLRAKKFKRDVSLFVKQWNMCSQYNDYGGNEFYPQLANFCTIVSRKLKTNKPRPVEDFTEGVELVDTAIEHDEIGGSVVIDSVVALASREGSSSRIQEDKSPCEASFDLAVMQVNEIFNSTGLDGHLSNELIRATWTYIENDEEIEAFSHNYDEQGLASEAVFVRKVMEALANIDHESSEAYDAVTSNSDIFTSFISGLAHVARSRALHGDNWQSD